LSSRWASQRAYGLQQFWGIGNIIGAMLGGVLIGVLSALSDQYLSSADKCLGICGLGDYFGLLPTRWFGENVQEKV